MRGLDLVLAFDLVDQFDRPSHQSTNVRLVNCLGSGQRSQGYGVCHDQETTGTRRWSGQGATAATATAHRPGLGHHPGVAEASQAGMQVLKIIFFNIFESLFNVRL